MINHEDQANIDALIEVLHHGVGLQDSSIKGTLKTLGRKLVNDIPLGADAPTFTSRKRFILISLQSDRVKKCLEIMCTIVILLIFVVMVWATYPDIEWWLFFAIPILAYWMYSSIISFNKIGQIISIIKAQEKIYPDPVANIQAQHIHNLNKHAKQFAKPRLLSRIVALFVMLISTYMMSLYTADAPSQLLPFYLFGPFAFMAAVGIMFCPINKAETLHLYGVTQIPFKYMPFFFKMCLLLGTLLSMVLFIVDTFGIDILS